MKVSGLRVKEANGVNPKDQYGTAKVPFGVIPPSADLFLALAMGVGADKYGPFNWRVDPVQALTYLEAAKRHLLLLIDGEDYDRDTGVHHGGFIMSTIAIYLDAMVNGKLIDNRPVAGVSGDLVAAFNLKPGQVRSPVQTAAILEQFLRQRSEELDRDDV